MTDALTKFQLLAQIATTVSARSTFRAKALETERDIELLKNERRAFLTEGASIDPPSEDVVIQGETLATTLAAIAAEEARAAAIIQIMSGGVQEIERVDTEGGAIVRRSTLEEMPVPLTHQRPVSRAEVHVDWN